MKKIISIALVLAMVFAINIQCFAFSDISGEELTVAVDTLQSMGLASGMGGDRYSPDTVLTRAQFCTFLIKTMGLEQKTSTVSGKLLFTDVKPGNWYTGYVNLAYNEKLVQGRGNGKFGPEDYLKYDETVTMLLKLLGFTASEIGKSWPDDFVNYAHYLELDEGVELSAKSVVNRGQAARLLYNALKTVPNHGSVEYYKTMKDVASLEEAIILESSSSANGKADQLKAFVPAAGGIKYYDKKNIVSDSFRTDVANIMLDRSGDVLGLVVTDKKDESLVISSADLSGIKGENGESVRIPASATLICGSDIYGWGIRGYAAADDASGKTASIYRNDDGNITYVVISAAGADSGTQTATAVTGSAATELKRALGAVSNCAFTKNNSAAGPEDLCAGDTAYYDSLTSTLRACDWTVSGYIEKAEPGIKAAETLVVSGCTLQVLDCAQDDLAQFTVGSKVTLRLTDDLKVAAAGAFGEIKDNSVGILAQGGRSIKLVGSGLVISAAEIKADEKLQGRLVTMSYSDGRISCKEPEMKTPGRNDKLNISAAVLENADVDLPLAAACSIYDQAGGSWLCSLEGVLGEASCDLSEIDWTDKLGASYVSGYHTDGSGRIDILVLNDATGNAYTYGGCELLTDAEGINLGSMLMPAYNKAAVITNASGRSGKYLCVSYKLPGKYYGLALRSDSSGYGFVCAKAELTRQDKLSADAFFVMDGENYVNTGKTMLRVSDSVQIYYEKNDRWESGEAALNSAVNSGLPLTVYYDRSAAAGGKVRIIELNN